MFPTEVVIPTIENFFMLIASKIATASSHPASTSIITLFGDIRWVYFKTKSSDDVPLGLNLKQIKCTNIYVKTIITTRREYVIIFILCSKIYY